VNEIITSPKTGICKFDVGTVENEYLGDFDDRCPNDGVAPPFLVNNLINNIEGSYQAVKHLIYLGHRNIAIITVPPNVGGSVERLEGYRLALQEAGLTLDKNYIKQGNSQVDDGFQVTVELLALPKPPTAIFAANNLMTIGVIKALRSRKIRRPGKMALIGFDNFELVICFSPTDFRRVIRRKCS
jgi:DNA-binding LacI/PurR family transcriptional regulator